MEVLETFDAEEDVVVVEDNAFVVSVVLPFVALELSLFTVFPGDDMLLERTTHNKVLCSLFK